MTIEKFRYLKFGIALALPAFGLAMCSWNGAQSFVDRQVLETRGVGTVATVISRQLKHCYGWRCNDPDYFRGVVGSAEYIKFRDNCSDSRGNPCWKLVTVAYSVDGKRLSHTESVNWKRFEELSPGRQLGIRYDPTERATARIDASTEGDVERTLLLVGAGALVFMAWLGWGVLINNRRERRGWGTGGYRQGR